MRAFSGLVLVVGALGAPQAFGQTPLTTELVAGGLNRPLWAGAPDGDPRLFVAEKTGRIKIVINGAVLTTPFLSLAGKVSSGSEQGLLGVAFHPNYAQNGWFFVNYTDLNGDTVVARFQVSATDPNLADPLSETLILAQPQPFDNHNGGDLHFGPDGYLYVMLGDGGSANDPGCRAQKLSSRLGKILRYDVDNGLPYTIPPTNPFVGQAGAFPEIWHYGVRNPWRVGFDRATGDLYIGDVGQDNNEEISFAPAGVGGLNFGWRVMEGTRCNGLGNCPIGTPACSAVEFTPPIYELFHGGAGSPASITGGYVYRGCAIPSLVGTYFFADYIDHKIRSLTYDTVNGVQNFQDRTAELAPGGGLAIRNIASFGEDGFGELLIVDHTASGGGEIWKIVPAGSVPALATARNGGGTNAACYANQSLPILGNLWRTTIDATTHAGATFVGIVAYAQPSSGSFFGASEILVDLTSSKVLQSLQPFTGGVVTFEGMLPCDPALDGMTAATQAFIVGGGVALCNAIDVTLGY